MANKIIPAIQTNEGNVGVGVTSPSQKLHVDGNILSSYNILTSLVQISSASDAASYISVGGYIAGLSYAGTYIGLASLAGSAVSANLYIGGGFPIIPAGWSGTISGVAYANDAALATSVSLQTSPDGSTWTSRSVTSASSGTETLTYSVSNSATPLYVRFTLNQSSGTAGVSATDCSIQNIIITNLPSLPNKSSISNRFLVDGLGNVGIGITNPVSKLHVSGAAATIMRLDSNTLTSVAQFQAKANTDGVLIAGMYGPNPVAGTVFGANTSGAAFLGTTTLATVHPTLLAIGTSNTIPIIFGTNSAERMRIAGAGNVGIGATSPAAKLDVVGNVLINGASNSNVAQLVFTRSDVSWGIFNETDLRFYSSNSNTTSPSTFRMTLTSAGNVGIGTANPATLLHVDTAGADARIRVSAGANTVQGGMIANTGTLLIYAGSVTNHGFSLRTFDTDRVRIDTNGNVGIGVTSPRVLLDLAKANNVAQVLLLGETSANIRVGFGLDPSNAVMRIFSYNQITDGGIEFGGISSNGSTWTRNHRLGLAAGNSFFNQQGGNVGIGTTNPNAKLDSYFASNALTFNYLATNLDGNSPIPAYAFDVTDGSLETRSIKAGIGYQRYLSNGRGILHFYNRSADTVSNIQGNRASIGDIRMSIDNNGNVGIGTVTPTSKLHVVETTPTGSRIQLGSISTSALMDANLVNDFLILTAPFNAVPASTSNNNAKWGIKMGGGSVDAPNALEKSACIYAVSEEDIGVGGAGAGYNRKVGLALHTSPFDLPSVERFRITNIGNVGIGVTNPSNKLQISGGGISFTTSTGLAVPMIGILPTNIAYVGPYNSPADGNSPTLVLFNHARSVQQTWFYASGTIAMSLNGQGRFHIGDLNNAPPALLNVGTTSSVAATGGMSFGNDASANLYRSAASTIKTDGSLTVVGGASFGGNVGIGSTSPAYKLDVNSSIVSRSTLSSPRFSSAGTYVYGVTNSPSWNQSCGTYTNNNATAPDGTTTAGTYTLTSVCGVWDLYQTISSLTVGRVYTIGMWVKLGTATNFCLVVNNTQAWNSIGGKAFTSSDGLSTGKWTHISFTFTAIAPGNVNLHLGYHSESAVTQQTAGTVFLWNIEMTEFSSTWIGNVEDEIRLPGSSIWTSRGNVGIGTTNPSGRLSVDFAGVSAFNVCDSASSNVRVTVGTVNDAGTNYGLIQTYQHNTNTAGVSPLTIQPFGGNVGIGITNSSALFHVFSIAGRYINFTPTSASGLLVQRNANVGSQGTTVLTLVNAQGAESLVDRGTSLNLDIGYGGTSTTTAGTIARGARIAALNHNIYDATAANQNAYLAFYTATGGALTEQLRITANGNVGIGTTNPTAKLQVVQSNAGGVAAILLSSDESTIQGPSANTQIRMGSNLVLNGSNILTLGTNNVTRMVIDVTGNVGIGTVAPTAQNNYKFLQVNGTTAAIIEAMVNNVRIGGIDSDSSSLYFGSIGSYPIVFRTAVVEKMRITAAGLVGIGTATPTTLLSVGGAGSTLPASGITFGGDAVTNLYRAQANILKTDATLQVAGNFDGLGTVQAIGSILHRSTIRVLNKAATDWVTWFTRDTSESETIGRLDNIRSINGSVAGNLGIGTTLPSGKLHVVSTVAGATVLRTDGTNGTLFSVVDDLSDSLMSVNNSAGLPVLEVFADDRVVAGQYGSGDFVLINNKVGLGTSNPANKLTVIGGASIGSSTYNTSAPSNGLIVQGNVGIGSTNPDAKLQVNGEIRIASSSSYFTHLNYLDGGSNLISSTNGGSTLFRGSSNNLTSMVVYGDGTVSTNYNTYLAVTNGNVGVGLTTPAYKLQVSGDVSIAGANVLRFGTVAVLNTNNDPQDIYANIRVIRNASTANTDGMFIGYNNGGAGAGHLRFYANATNERMRIQANDGHVGIGTDTAAGRLDVYNDTNGEHILSVRNNNSGVNAFSAIVLRRNGNTNGLVMFTNSSNRTTDGGAGNSTIRTDNGKLLVGAGATTYHSFETNGDVGIGLTNPAAARLHIKGNGSDPVLRVESAVLVAGTTTASKTFVAWMPIMTGAAVGDKVFIPLFK